MAYKFQFRDVLAQQDAIVDGLVLTLQLSVGIISLGFVSGVVVATVLVYGKPWARRIAGAYVEVIRNTPLIVQLFLIFFGLPSLGLKLDVITASVLALTINLAAYTAEIVRAGLESIPKSQIEAGISLGLTGRQVFWHIVLLPALKNVYPSLTSQFVLMMLATSVVSQISAAELFHAGSIIQSRTFRDFEVFTVIAVLYLCLSLVMRVGFSVCYRIFFRR
ncbi:MAG: amino acid ABC transporter permease [Betaproteobacteria bacterium]|nr:amino acid ABC transporter permease [Betaproteobacteria bacterium]MBA3774829.1 amino acid ABC transporter permease [Betaproteobacteria bacterium]